MQLARLFVITVLLACEPALFAAQDAAFTATITGSATIPNNATFDALGSWRWEMRVTAYTLPGSYCNLVNSGGTNYQIGLNSAGVVAFVDWTDSHGGNGIVAGSLTAVGITDFIVRATRNTATLQTHLEMWNASTGAYTINTQVLDSAATRNMSGTMSFGGTGASNCIANISYVRWYGSAVALATKPTLAAGGDLGDWEFEGNGNDAASPAKNITFSGGTPSYPTTPVYVPITVAGTETGGLRAGYPYALDGTGSWSTSAAIASYSWQQIGGPTTLKFSSRTSGTPTIEGAIFGQYDFRLMATDANGLSSAGDVSYGFVSYDANGVVVASDLNRNFLFGPLMRLGGSPWTYLDTMHVHGADTFGGLLATSPAYADTWSTALGGTISVTNGSTTVTGTGTAFQTNFCSGGTSPERAGDTEIVVWFSDGLGGFAKRDHLIASCPSQTSITLASAYGSTSGTTGSLNYSKLMYVADWSSANGSANNNYYDVVMAQYALYYRSGLTKYLTYARTLADRWWSQPAVDQMNSAIIGLDTGPRTLAPRATALAGVMWRAYEDATKAGNWTKIYAWIDFKLSSVESASTMVDIREDGYQFSHTAIAAHLGPTGAKRTAYLASLATALSAKWTPQKQTTAGSNWWGNTYYSNSSGTSVRVTNGSPTVTGTGGTNFLSVGSGGSCAASGNNWFWAPPDTVAYRVSSVANDALMTLSTNYAGTTRDVFSTSTGWNCKNLVGFGTQPFILGNVASGMSYAFKTSAVASAGTNLADMALYIGARGISTTGVGLYYGTESPNCLPTPESVPECYNNGNRFFQGEAIAAFGDAYLNTGTASLKTNGDLLMGKMIGHDSVGPSADGSGAAEFTTGNMTTATPPKNYGFLFGYGKGASYPAARLGGPAAAANRTVQVGGYIAGVPGATQIRVTLTYPSGATSTATCSSSPCSVTADANQGAHRVRREFLSAGSAVLASSESDIQSVQ